MGAIRRIQNEETIHRGHRQSAVSRCSRGTANPRRRVQQARYTCAHRRRCKSSIGGEVRTRRRRRLEWYGKRLDALHMRARILQRHRSIRHRVRGRRRFMSRQRERVYREQRPLSNHARGGRRTMVRGVWEVRRSSRKSDKDRL